MATGEIAGLRETCFAVGIKELSAPAGSEILSGQAWADVAAKSFTRKRQAREDGRRLGPTSGIAQLDASMDGECLPVGVTVITGGPGSGKTALALQAAVQNKNICPVLYVSAEMGTDVVFHRLVANLTDTYIYKFSGKLSEQEYHEIVAQALPDMSHILHIKDRNEFITVDALRATAIAQKGDHEFMLIVIDSFHSWAIADVTKEEERELFERLLRELGALAEELNASIMLIAEQNRASAQVAGLSSAAGTRKFEYCAELVINLERHHPDEEEETDRGKPRGKKSQKPTYTRAVTGNPENRRAVRLGVWKNRHGASDFYIETEFIGQKMRFEEAVGANSVSVEEAIKQFQDRPVFGDTSHCRLSRVNVDWRN